MKLNDNNYHLLRCLIGILKESSNPTAMAVASHDLGEYVRYYPRGKKYTNTSLVNMPKLNYFRMTI